MSRSGKPLSEETKRKIAEKARGRKKPEGWGARHSEKMKEHYKTHPCNNKPKFKHILTKELLYDLYVTDKMSIRSVAKFCNVSAGTIRRYLMDNNIERRPNSIPLDIFARRSRHTKYYHMLAFDVYGFKRECSACGDSGVDNYLVVHHLNKDRYDNSKENLMVLCNACHSRMHRVVESFDKRLNEPEVAEA